ncbi:MAG: hypothetical protein K1X72_15660 [Pyrinomonadaceae bacterium]|nr:hypothetical protein [Pyrinomonadaceae bacterium]
MKNKKDRRIFPTVFRNFALVFLKPSFGQFKIIAKIAKEKSKGVDGIKIFVVWS